jgi:uncharacterized protein
LTPCSRRSVKRGNGAALRTAAALFFVAHALALGCGGSSASSSLHSPAASSESAASAKSAAAALPDEDRAACARGDGSACERAGSVYRQGGDPSGGAYASDQKLFRAACERDVAGACAALGWTLLPGEETAAIALFARACTGGSARGCMSLGEAYEAGRGVPKDEARALSVYRGACDAGAAEACAKSAVMLDTGRGAPSDPKTAAVHFKKACDGGVADACSALAIATSLGNGVPRDETEAAALFKRGCEAGSALGCAGLGDAYAKGRGVAKDDVRAADLLRKTCASGIAISCRVLAELLSDTSSRARDDAEAVRLFTRACGDGDAAACASSGALIEVGRGAPADPALAASFWTRACNAGNAAGCTRLGMAHLKGRGVQKDAVKGATLLEKACSSGSSSACNVLGIAHAFGDEVPRDNARAESLFRAACEQGSPTGCSRLGLCYKIRKAGAPSYDFGISQAAADCRRTALACEWLGGVPREQAEMAFKLLVQSCDAEVGAACGSLARAIAGGRVPKSAAQAVMGEIRGHCNQGKAVWCRRLAFWHEEGLSVAKSDAVARDFYKRACDGGDVRGCGDLGRMMATGQGGKKDIEGATALLKRTCAGTAGGLGAELRLSAPSPPVSASAAADGAVACGHLGMIYINDGQAADREVGARLLDQACAQGDGLACDRLGGFYAVGAKGFAKDERRAADLLERACALGGYACDDAKRLRERFGVEGLR